MCQNNTIQVFQEGEEVRIITLQDRSFVVNKVDAFTNDLLLIGDHDIWSTKEKPSPITEMWVSARSCVKIPVPTPDFSKRIDHAHKPPIGLMRRQLWDEQRMDHITRAINRFMDAGMKIPLEWIEEYNEIAERLINLKKAKK